MSLRRPARRDSSPIAFPTTLLPCRRSASSSAPRARPDRGAPLHIFEPRYKELIGECIAGAEPFGLLLEDDSGRRYIGTLVDAREVVHMFDDSDARPPRRGPRPLPGDAVKPMAARSLPPRRWRDARGRGRRAAGGNSRGGSAGALLRLADVADAETPELDVRRGRSPSRSPLTSTSATTEAGVARAAFGARPVTGPTELLSMHSRR